MTTTSTATLALPHSLSDKLQEQVYLCPRPYERQPGVLVLLPLLPQRKPLPTLPEDVWRRVFEFLIRNDIHERTRLVPRIKGLKLEHARTPWGLAVTCKYFNLISLPLLYSQCKIDSCSSLYKLTGHLSSSDQKWDSIRRIPYSTPGRWIQTLDLSSLSIDDSSTASAIDTHLNIMFPLLPFLCDVHLSPSIELSRRTMGSFSFRDGAQNLRRLNGVRYGYDEFSVSREDPLTVMISQLPGLEELEVRGFGAEMSDSMAVAWDHHQPRLQPFVLPRLHSLKIVGIPASPLLDRLVVTPLPSLRSVVITPYEAWSSINALLAAHFATISSIVFYTPQSWPMMRFLPPRNLFNLLPNLKSLSIETSNFAFELPVVDVFLRGPPLQILSVSRPTAALREEFFRFLPYLSCLRAVKARDVRWAKKGISDRAREAGFQGEMLTWRRLLNQRQILMLDADGLAEPAA